MQLGVHGKAVAVPAVLGAPAGSVAYIHLLIVGVLALMLGWKVLPAAAILYFISQNGGLGGAGGGPAPPAGGGGAAGGGGGGGPGNRAR
jgi:hypothetical protein